MKNYNQIKSINYDPNSKDPFTFHYYNPDEVIMGKKMKDHLRFALSYWHTINASGTDMFGGNTMDKTFNLTNDPLAMYKAKADFAFELMNKLNIDYYCFHDVDIAPEGKTLEETYNNFKVMVSYLAELNKKYNKKVLWNTANNFADARFMAGAATSPFADAFALAAFKVKMGLDAAKELGAEGYVFWGGREGYDTLLNTDVGLELDNLAYFMQLAVDYAKEIGFTGQFYIEPKPKEPTKHQYDFDVATVMNFLRTYKLDKYFKMNIEANHATLAGHTFNHEIRMAAVNGSFGSIDANQGDLFLGWDTDQFPTNIYDTTWAMYEILKAGGFTTGGLNFDAKTRRQSNTFDDILLSYIAGMDAFALGLRNAVKIIEDKRIDDFVEERYESYTHGIGEKITKKNTSFNELSQYALKNNGEVDIKSGRQEYLENIVNQIMFGK